MRRFDEPYRRTRTFSGCPRRYRISSSRVGAVWSGRYDDGFGYILIKSWDNGDKEALEQGYAALEKLAGCKGLIVDVRFNAGGSETLAGDFAGCFVDKSVVYAKHVYRDTNAPGGFGKACERVLNPSGGRPKYRGKVAVLSGRYVMSSCEAFLLMMKTLPACKVVGEASYGSSGNPRSYELPNGITVSLSSWQAMLPDGRVFEGQGIEPDIPVKTEADDFKGGDPVLEAALEWLRKK